MKIKPIYDRVLLRPVKTQNSLGLIIPESDTKSTLMEVVGLGESPKGFAVNLGDKVLINSYAGYVWTHENETYILVKETDILAIIKENENE